MSDSAPSSLEQHLGGSPPPSPAVAADAPMDGSFPQESFPSQEPPERSVPAPFCSVLTTVVDYIMADPCPLEPLEFQRLQPTEPDYGAVATESAAAARARSDSVQKVPVLRIFGPILRRDGGEGPGGMPPPPRQSACLYVHGAFPYLLARPVVAGPDGGTGTGGNDRRRTDWDSERAVRALLPLLEASLEATLQASLGSGGDSDRAPPPPAAPRFLRRLSVVMGRGFYTYCPGPAAPFLRVEYYDPSQRWRIKLALEQGLPDVPERFHPDPRRYDYGGHGGGGGGAHGSQGIDDGSSEGDDGDSNCGAPEPLAFNCFEAHIPYTMQFFKDYNLAGMSYVHLEQALFRRELPLTPAPSRSYPTVHHRIQSLPRDDNGKDVDEEGRDCHLFLRANTKQVWSKAEDRNSGKPVVDEHTPSVIQLDSELVEVDANAATNDMTLDNLPDLHQATPPDQTDMGTPINSQVPSQQLPSLSLQEQSLDIRCMCYTKLNLMNYSDFPGGPWSKCQTSCQVELDTTTAHILNIHDVLTEKQEQPAGDNQKQQPICWRAVPSLQTIWTQERRRMRRLLQPKDDFLSQPMPLIHAQLDEQSTTPPLTLTETKAARSGARLAREGMDRLVGISDGLHEAHRKAAGDILRRHFLHIDRVDAQVATSRRKAQNLIERPQLSVDSNTERPDGMTPTDEEALQALYRLGSENTQTEVHLSSDQIYAKRHSSSPMSQHSVPPINNIPDIQTSMSYSQHSNRSDFVFGSYELPLSQPYVHITQRSGNWQNPLDWEAERELTQRIDRGDGILDGADEYIDPETLRPFEDMDDDDNFEIMIEKDNLPVVDSKSNDAPVETNHDDVFASDIQMHAPCFPRPVDNLSPWQCEPEENGDDIKEAAVFPQEFRNQKSTETAMEGGDGETVASRINFENEALKPILAGTFGKESNRSTCNHTISQAIISSNEFLPPSRGTVVAWLKRHQISDSDIPYKRSRLTYQGDKQCANEIEFCKNRPVFSMSSEPGLTPTQIQAEFSKVHSNQQALLGIGNQGGKLHVEAGGELKAATRPSQGSCSYIKGELPCPVSLMVIEIHVQCRKGKDASSRALALTPQSDRDRVSAIVYVLGIDPGGGEALHVVERGCLLVPPAVERESANNESEELFLARMKNNITKSMPPETMGKSSPLSVECLSTERQLILRFASLVRWKDPDFICSWDTQGAGLGYLIERSARIKSADTTCENESDIDLAKLLGRTPTVSIVLDMNNPDTIRIGNQLDDNDGENLVREGWKGSGMGTEWDERVGAGAAASSIIGRLVFASWKLVAEEVKHPNASYLQALIFAVTGRRIPFHDNLKLTSWFGENKGKDRWRVLHYRLVQAMSTIILFDALDVIGRAGEAARLSGVELSQSFPGIRGSQYKVEGVLLRALQSLSSEDRGFKRGYRPSSAEERSNLSDGNFSRTQSPWKGRRSEAPCDENLSETLEPAHGLAKRRYFFYSPSLRAADRQEALQVQALTLEPKSGHYKDPVVVCDFTALYPSLVIAYNLCYSTIGGHLEYLSTRGEMGIEGRTTGKIGPLACPEGRSATILKHHMKSLIGDGTDRCYIAPTGDIYVSEDVIKGVLPQVLEEILTTRAMLKRAAKLYKSNVKGLPPAILRQLEARQLALKYVANVTYGYTSATFSGRCAMPRLADTIVECGRRTLTNAINLANDWGRNQNGKWFGCSVLYGDTDSVFVKLPGRTLHEAFEFGKEFCKAVTRSNPPPIELKLEKVYMGSIMQTKKKYCGMKYESVDEKRPDLECKGIETIRRDQCALTQKVLSSALKILFDKGVGALKEYLIRQWRLIESGGMPVSDFILTGRVRSQYRATLPVQAALARRLTEYDPGRIVRHKERLAYVIVAAPGKVSRLSDSVLTPLELMEHWDLYTLNTNYYITKHVNAALQRCLGLAPHNIDVHDWYRLSPKPRKRIHFWPTTGRTSMISSFFGSDICWFCSRKSRVSGRSHVSICASCRSSEARSVELASRCMNRIQKESQALAQTCSRCNLCFEDSGTFAAVAGPAPSQTGTLQTVGERRTKVKIQSPLANCTCTDCPVFHQRHRAREDELELRAVFQALGID